MRRVNGRLLQDMSTSQYVLLIEKDLGDFEYQVNEYLAKKYELHGPTMIYKDDYGDMRHAQAFIKPKKTTTK